MNLLSQIAHMTLPDIPLVFVWLLLGVAIGLGGKRVFMYWYQK